MEFRILGPLEARSAETPLPLGGPKQRALLAVLIIHLNEVVSIDRIIDDLWGEDVPDTAWNAVQVYVSHLRKVLGDGDRRGSEILLTRRPGYELQVNPEDVDLGRFLRLAAEGRTALESGAFAEASVKLADALAIWRGPPLADFRYEPFAQTEIDRLEELRLSTTEDRGDADLAFGRHATLVGTLEPLVTAHPLRERLRGQLMLALYRSNRQADALRVYQEGLRAFRDELGLDPAPDLQRLNESILQQDSSLDLPRRDPSGSALPDDIVSDAAAVEPGPLGVGRSSEDPAAQRDAFSDPSEGDMATVAALFADIAGSTSLAERLSAEEVRAVIGECVSRMSRVVESYGGMVQAYLGDGIAAYFGMPTPHEDDALRASLAGLELVRAADEYAGELLRAWSIESFSVRVGVNVGRVAVGTVGAAEPQVVAFGDPMNVASRLEAAAAAGTVVVGDDVARRLPSRFVLEPLGDLRLKGRSAPATAWRLLGIERHIGSVAATPLVGRDNEVARLEQTSRDLMNGRGQVLLIGGEAGIGKSRMIGELRDLCPPDVAWLEGRCASYGGATSFRPFVEALQGWLGLSGDEPEVIARTKVRTQLQELSGEAWSQLAVPLGAMLSVRVETNGLQATGSLTTNEGVTNMRKAYRGWLERLCERSPVVVALEDIHSADDASCELAKELLAATDALPLLIVMSGRHMPGSAGWRLWMHTLEAFRHRTIELDLGPLPDAAVATLADLLSSTSSLDEFARSMIVSRAEGNPFYIEELVRTLSETGGLERTKGWTLSMSAPGLILSPALESLLGVRIQNLPPGARHLAQLAAVIGREFPVMLLERLTTEDEVKEHLPTLLRREIVRERRRYPQLVCAFRNSLLQQAAIASLTPARAKQLYRIVGGGFEELYADEAGDHADRLAFYYYRGDEPFRAMPFLESAASQLEGTDRDRAIHLWERVRRLAADQDNADAVARAGRALKRLGENRG